ncbi:hypothetical protein GHK52_07060 [Lactococcus garvieae]|nr:hypothetical protein [Lactococcus garvieae]
MKLKDSGVEWIGEIPEDWEMKKVRYFLKEVSEKKHPNEQVLSLYRDYGVIPKDSRADNHNVTSSDTSGYKFVEVGNLVINKMKAWQGSLAISNFQGIISPAYFIYRIIDSRIDLRFLHYALRNPAYKQEYMRISSGLRVGQWDLNKEEFKNLFYPFPEQKEQQKIADFLDSKIVLIDQIIADTKRSIEELKAYKQSLITEVVTKGLKHSTDFSIYLTKIKYIAEIDPPYDEKIDENELATFLPMDRLKNGYLINDTQKSIKELKNKYSYFADGDIIIAKVRPSFENGNLALASGLENGLGFGTTEIYTIRNKKTKNFSSRYLAYYLRNTDFINQGSSTMTGVAGLKRISAQFIQNYHIPKISFEEGETIADFLDGKIKNIDGLIYEKFNLINEYESYKKSLIYEYVTGKKQVN